MLSNRQGLSTIEVMIALFVLAVGAFGALGTTALAWRSGLRGERLAGSARAIGSVLDSIRGALIAGERQCSVLAPGRDTAGGAELSWRPTAAAGGRAIVVEFSTRFPGLAGDSAWTFLWCQP